MSNENVVEQISTILQEDNTGLIARLLTSLGQDRLLDLVRKTIEIQESGGQMVKDGSRKRTMGGVLVRLIRDTVSPSEKTACFSRRKKQVSV